MTKIKPKDKPVEYSPEDFMKAIDDLSNKMGYSLNVSPELFQQDNGTFSIKIKISSVKK